MPKALQAPALILLIVGLSLLRLLPAVDPIAPLLRSVLRSDDSASVDSTDSDTADGKLEALEERVSMLETELDFKTRSEDNLLAARIISKTAVSFRQAVRIDRGSQDGIRADMPVVSDGHLVGLVESVEPDVATVVLIGDRAVAVPVRIGTAQGIIKAYAGGVLIDSVVGEAEPGQPVITSGVGGLYPPGLLVGSVGQEVERDIYSQYVLERPNRLFELEVLQVVL